MLSELFHRGIYKKRRSSVFFQMSGTCSTTQIEYEFGSMPNYV